MMKLLWLILLPISLVECDAMLTQPPVATVIVARAEWTGWYGEMERCSGLTGDAGHVRYYEATDEAMEGVERGAMGLWYPAHAIYLRVWVVQVNLQRTIQHEQLHDVIQSGAHPAVFDVCDVR